MSKKCSFCKTELQGEPAFEVCKSCGIKIWGEKMYNAIAQNMEGARDNGDLYQGSVTNPSVAKDSGRREVIQAPKNNPSWTNEYG